VLATLASLRIKNLALVDDLTWELQPGFVAVTGETGAGKSVILGALKLLVGERADKSLIRTGADACTVEAVFRVPDAKNLNATLAARGLEPCEDGELLLKRSFAQGGTNRQFVNGSATTLAVLKEIGSDLVDLHGPHDHQSLLSADRQLDLLDAFAHAGDTRAAYEAVFRQLQKLRAEFDELSSVESSAERELELLRHQVSEIRSADPKPEEDVEITGRYRLATNSKRLIELSTGIAAELSESEPSILSRLAETGRLLRELARLDAAGVAALQEAHESAVLELEELARSLAQYAGGLDLDPKQLSALEERVTLLETLKRKYGGDLAAVLAHADEAELRLNRIENRGEELARLKKAIAGADADLRKVGGQLSALRAKAAPALSADVRGQLRELGFKNSEFEIRLARLEQPGAKGLESAEFVFAPRSSGLEAVEFLFAPNPGEPAKPLRSIASSGEISRVMLAVKSVLAKHDAVPLLVFDEIDANVGGEIAVKVGARMRELGRSHQVLCITHLPQVAAQAATHFVVEKHFESGRTQSKLFEVKGPSRRKEIARMLGGENESSLALAKTLLGKAE
jgi:DNA repair protein RecN (Recombination protein N)